ncbi:MAG: hypothetical protein RLZZ365_1185 [Pseudomonadota bacterium]|jgi:hypothetical protein
MFGAIPDLNQSLEMFKTMWGQNATGTPGASFMPDMGVGISGFNGAMPTFDVEELDKRIKDLKSVESWLSLNLNVLKSTIQTLEVQRATLMAIKSFGEALATPPSPSGTEGSSETKSKERKSAKSRPRPKRAARSSDATGSSGEQ